MLRSVGRGGRRRLQANGRLSCQSPTGGDPGTRIRESARRSRASGARETETEALLVAAALGPGRCKASRRARECPADRHCSLVAELLRDGEVVPFLGAGANLCDRPEEAAWELGRFPPSGGELAATLAERSRYPVPEDLDLLRVSQYVDATLGEGQLYRYLHATSTPTIRRRRCTVSSRACRRCCASGERPQLLVLTTNYDDLVERALADAGEPFDVVWYEAKRGPVAGPVPPPPARRETSCRSSVRTSTRGSPRRANRRAQAARRDRPRRRQAGQLRDHRGQLHRLPRGRRRRGADPRSRCASGWRTATSSSSATRCATGTCA